MAARGASELDATVPMCVPTWLQRRYRGCQTFSLETGAGYQRYSHRDEIDCDDGRAAFDGSTDDSNGVGISASWRGEDDVIRVSAAWLPLPYVRGSAACELLSLRLLCRRLLQVGHGGTSDDPRSSRPRLGRLSQSSLLYVMTDNEHVRNYINFEEDPGRDSIELLPLVQAAREDVQRAEAAYGCRLQLVWVPRNTELLHKMCDHSARSAMRQGRDHELRAAVPKEWRRSLQAYINIRLLQRGEAHRVRSNEHCDINLRLLQRGEALFAPAPQITPPARPPPNPDPDI